MASRSLPTGVVFDVHVYVNALIGPDSTFPLLAAIPPSTSNAAADCLSLALDADEFSVYVSPHILTNTVRVLRQLGISAALTEKYIDTILDIVTGCGGRVIDPSRTIFDVRDYEDNLILDLVVATDSLILVSDDTDLTHLSPWNGRLIRRPREFVRRIIQSRRRH